jgi:hypothetical protein
VTRGPASLPSFIYDLAQTVGEFVNEQTDAYASTGVATYPLAAPEGGKEALQASFVPLTLGSDHEVYADSTFGIPAIYLNDWPDRYIHTNFDVPANIDPTKLLRAGFIAAVSGYVLSRLDPTSTQAMVDMIQTHGLERAATAMRKHDPNALEFASWYERAMCKSLARFGLSECGGEVAALKAALPRRTPRGPIYRRNMSVKGPMSVFGYDYFADHYKQPVRLTGDAAYEALNFADGIRTTSEIRDALSVIYGDVALKDVEQYLAAAESIGIVSKVNGGQP